MIKIISAFFRFLFQNRHEIASLQVTVANGQFRLSLPHNRTTALNGQELITGPVTVWFRFLKSILCPKGDKPWHHHDDLKNQMRRSSYTPYQWPHTQAGIIWVGM